VYTPKSAPYDELMVWENHIGVQHACIIAMAAYGMDNSSMLAALEKLGGKGRGVVVINPDTITDEELNRMHAIGVRGIRVNFHTRKDKITREAFRTLVQKYANRIRRLNWVIQFWIELYQFALVADVIPELGVDVVVDHLGGPHSTTMPIQQQEGQKEVLKLLREKKMYVKLSGIYRFNGEGMPGLDEYITEILRDAPDQVVWGSDRPHPAGPERNPDGDRMKTQDYLEIDIPAFIERCRAWAGHDEALIKKIFVDNPRRLWRYDYDD
jgi:predicted TIM-barrel fold metal-dependent hydrolase